MEILRLAGALLAIAFIFYLAWLVPRVIAKRHSTGAFGGRHLQVMEKVSLGKDSQLVLVRVGGRRMLLGVTPGGVTHLSDLEPSEADPPQPEPDARPFAEIFRESVSESLPKGRVRDAFDKIMGGKAEKSREDRAEDR